MKATTEAQRHREKKIINNHKDPSHKVNLLNKLTNKTSWCLGVFVLKISYRSLCVSVPLWFSFRTLADCLIAAVNRRLGCETTATFDRKAARLAGFEILA